MKIKFINYLLLFFIIFLNYNGFVKSDCYQELDLVLSNSCRNGPSKLVIHESIYSFESIELTPFVQPKLLNYYSWDLQDGINYFISYRYKNCSNIISKPFASKGMYYKLLAEPLCLNTYIPVRVYNWGAGGIEYNFYSVPSTIWVNSQNGLCSFQSPISPQSYTKGVLNDGALKFVGPTCGFKNGTITIDLTKGYSNYHLFLQSDYLFDNEIQPSSEGFYNGLESENYSLFVDSEQCATERIEIYMKDVFAPLEIDFENVPDLFHNSTISLSLSSGNNGILNNTNINAFVIQSERLLTDWNHVQTQITSNTYYGYAYNKDFSTEAGQTKCVYSETLLFDNYSPNFNFTISKSESCLENVSITFYPLPNQNIKVYDYSSESGIPFSMKDNVLSVENNLNLWIFDTNQNYGIVHSTVFDIPSYKIIETSNGIGCWKTYNITIVNYENYKNLRIHFYNENSEFNFYPVEGVFINVPALYYYVTYNAGDCETESYFVIDKLDRNTPMDNVVLEFNTLEIGNCTHETSFMVTVKSVFGSYSKTMQTFYDKEFTIFLPNCSCQINGIYVAPRLIDGDSLIYELLTDPNCNSTDTLIRFTSPSQDYSISSVYQNGVQLQYYNNLNGYYISSGENNITVNYEGDQYCYRTETITIQSVYEVPLVQITPVSDCRNPNGKIEISNFQIFYNLELVFNSNSKPINQGFIENLASGTYTINYYSNQTCINSITVYVPSSENVAEITTSVISNPTCDNGPFSDGMIRVALKYEGNQINNFTIQNQDAEFTYLNDGVYPIAGVGVNSLTISYLSCIWKRDITTVLNKPSFTLEKVFNDTCDLQSVYKLVSSNPNIEIDYIDSSNGFSYLNNYYLVFQNSGDFGYYVAWNSRCYEYYTQQIIMDNYDRDSNVKYIDYEIVKPDNCNSLKIDLIITNMNKFISLTIENKLPTPINSTHSIFKNLPPSKSYDILYTLLNGCVAYQTVGIDEFKSGFTKETIDIIKTSDICYSGKASIQLSNLDFDNYYYYIKNSNSLMGVTDSYDSIQPQQSGNINGTILLSNYNPGSYKIYRGCKSMANCYLETNVVIESEDPIIESISVTDSYDKLNNGTVEIKLNYNSPYPINFKIIGTQLSNQNGKFGNLTPKTYEVQVTLTDRMCPVTLSKSFTINLKTSPPTPSPQDPSDELSTSSFVQVNLLFLSILIFTIFIF
ncbi:hypothetical protein DDB_G0271238 [Dictyostelium discoideum AX4]|uniref:Putative uncharacterized protein DDB_G0271238 n=1 Tax=Dictyostelium discoideum TaxID=44689 RepID=Y1238_DICDI|nr:hypothetical protein DDB_G0271238 [Dictyostelium discoideum AX4]Q55B99.1 RecName: Full=Putative uncharacterized protein DDB_G0271238; Flags: Precursor [Dictyostelium discoideum]EAL71749.1 hypothetical protein DDB_G0271238 [Dictyostelium discoideum AX4]|eukprot:XP_645713.1 hypothetical protein DDB_G0271238 [Dictyostelium discoideum AX4]